MSSFISGISKISLSCKHNFLKNRNLFSELLDLYVNFELRNVSKLIRVKLLTIPLALPVIKLKLSIGGDGFSLTLISISFLLSFNKYIKFFENNKSSLISTVFSIPGRSINRKHPDSVLIDVGFSFLV